MKVALAVKLKLFGKLMLGLLKFICPTNIIDKSLKLVLLSCGKTRLMKAFSFSGSYLYLSATSVCCKCPILGIK